VSLLSARQDDEVMAEINITPFTDVLLVLLIIFMILAALVTPPGFQKQLPGKSAAASQPKTPPKSIDVIVTDTGAISVDGQATDEHGLYAVMASDVRKRGKLHVSITADSKVKYDLIIKILDAARLAGIEDVGFVTT
jgi:biopolymer transport protein ExbD